MRLIICLPTCNLLTTVERPSVDLVVFARSEIRRVATSPAGSQGSWTGQTWSCRVAEHRPAWDSVLRTNWCNWSRWASLLPECLPLLINSRAWRLIALCLQPSLALSDRWRFISTFKRYLCSLGSDGPSFCPAVCSVDWTRATPSRSSVSGEGWTPGCRWEDQKPAAQPSFLRTCTGLNLPTHKNTGRDQRSG